MRGAAQPRFETMAVRWMTSLVAVLSWAAAVPPDCVLDTDVVFLLDVSESLLDQSPAAYPLYAWRRQQQFLQDVVGHLPLAQDGLHLALVNFSSDAREVFDFHQHKSSIQAIEHIKSLQFLGGNTNGERALITTRSLLRKGRQQRHVCVVFSDGLFSGGKDNALREAESLKRNTEVFVVTTTEEVDDHMLRQMASSSSPQHMMMQQGVAALDDNLALTLAHRICGVPDPPEMCLPNCRTCDGSNRCLRCTKGYFVQGGRCKACMAGCARCADERSCEECELGWFWEERACRGCHVTVDLVFLIDNSGSIRDKNNLNPHGEDNYMLLLEFVNSIIDRLDVGPQTTRIGALRFSDVALLEFHLDEYSTKERLRAHVLDMVNRYEKQHTNTAAGLRMAREDLFVKSRGDREGVRNVIILVTDGVSTMDKNLTVPEAMRCKEKDIVIFVAGVTGKINAEEMMMIASYPPKDHFFETTAISSLNSIIQSLIKHVCV